MMMDPDVNTIRNQYYQYQVPRTIEYVEIASRSPLNIPVYFIVLDPLYIFLELEPNTQ